MKPILRIISVNVPSAGTSYDAVFVASDCSGGTGCTCAPFDHDDETVSEFEPAGIVARWLDECGYPIIYQDGRLLHLAKLTDVQRAEFHVRWGI